MERYIAHRVLLQFNRDITDKKKQCLTSISLPTLLLSIIVHAKIVVFFQLLASNMQSTKDLGFLDIIYPKIKKEAKAAAKAYSKTPRGRAKARRTLIKSQVRNRAIIASIKSTSRCLSCNEARYACLTFHHRDPSQKNDFIPNLVQNGVSEQKLREEIAKCDIICFNCHHKLHCRGNRGNLHWKKMMVLDWRAIVGCKCGNHDSDVLTFHHRNPQEKNFEISKCKKIGIKKIIDEIAKCDVMCMNCHMYHHWQQKQNAA